MSLLYPHRARPAKAFEPRGSIVTSVLIALVLAGSAWAHAQLLNPGFEDGGGSLSGWQVFGSGSGNVGAAPTTPHSGSWVASLSGPWDSGSGYAYSGITQGVATEGGTFWTVSAYVRHNDDARLYGSNELILKLEFYRRFGGTYGTGDFIGETGISALDITSPSESWHKATVGAVAPPEAVEVRVALVFIQKDSAEGTALVDDVSLTSSPSNGSSPDGIAWSLLWHDEFDGPSVDPANWLVHDGHIIKNNELQYYDPDDVYLDNGSLVLRSRRHDPPLVRPHPNGGTAEFEYTSGLVESPGLFSHAFGWIEVRAKLPSTRGIWPAHWMLGNSFPDTDWPRCGEVDIMELLGHEPNTVYFTRHWGNPYEHSGTSYSGPDFSDDFHTFALWWTVDEMSWYVDGSLLYRTSITDAGAIFGQPFYLILNTAVGGDWPGFPNSTTVFPQYHEIDYVRWWVEGEVGDVDADGDVDAEDAQGFESCFSGTDMAWEDPACRFFDNDADADIDCDDWSNFKDHWTGPPEFPPILSECGLPAPRHIRARLR